MFEELIADWDGERVVIRYDQRDTGRSTTYEPGNPGYGGKDLLADAVSLLDAYELASAHLVGVSAGGALVQLLALDHWSRVRSLVLISTSPATSGARGLPPPSAAFTEFARGLIEAHGGRMWTETIPGQGSRFWFALSAENAVRRAV